MNVVLLQPMVYHIGADIYTAAGRNALKNAVTHEQPTHSSLLSGTAADGEEPTVEQVCRELKPVVDLQQSVPEELHHLEKTHTGAVLEELQTVGKTHVGAVHEGLNPVGTTPTEAGKKFEEEEEAEMKCYELTITLIIHPCATWWGGDRRSQEEGIYLIININYNY